MKINFISLEILTYKDLGFSLIQLGLNANKGALVVMKGIRNNNFFYLHGSTVIRGVKVASFIPDAADDTLRLWHIRLEHIGKDVSQSFGNTTLTKRSKNEKIGVL